MVEYIVGIIVLATSKTKKSSRCTVLFVGHKFTYFISFEELLILAVVKFVQTGLKSTILSAMSVLAAGSIVPINLSEINTPRKYIQKFVCRFAKIYMHNRDRYVLNVFVRPSNFLRFHCLTTNVCACVCICHENH